MSYKYKSGAQKRREKCEEEKDARKGQLSLGHFFTSKHPSPSEIDTTQTHQDSSSQDNDAGEYSRDSSSPRPVPEPKCKGKDAAEAASPRPVPEPMCDVQELVFSSESEKFCDVGDPNFDVYVDLKYPHLKLPSIFPDDRVGASVPVSIFKKKLTNGELVPRDWLVWSRLKEAFYCLPCKLFSSVQPAKQSLFASSDGYSAAQRWKKMYDRVPEHEGTPTHKSSYIQWRMEVKKIKSDSSLNDLLLKSMVSEREKWKEILKRLLHVTLFLAERGLAFRGDSCKIGDPSNGNFLGLLELLGNYDPVLSQHLETVRQSQENGTRLQVHYLSPETQNELIEACSAQIVQMILKEREKAKYYSIIVDATPDTSHVEQTAIIIRYLHFEGEEESYEVKERLLAFADCSQKTGVAIADLIIKKLNEYRIPLSDCRGQGYDNGSNMKGAYKGVQAIILGMNSLAVYSACACHSLNLCGEQAAECCPPAITFFGAVQKLYNIFSSSPQRWEIFQANVPNNLHSMSQTRWSARVDSVKPIARHLPGVLKALDDVLKLNLTSECRRDVLGLQKHLKTFNFLLLSSIWTKILQAVDIVNKVIQQRGGTLDVASTNLNNLIEELKVLRNERWDEIFHETQAVAKNIGWPTFLEEEGKRSKKRKKLWDDDNEETDPEQSESKLDVFKREVYFVVLDSIVGDLTQRFESLKTLNDLFSVLWTSHTLPDNKIETLATELVQSYSRDVGMDLVDELKNMNVIYSANFGRETLPPLNLINSLKKLDLEQLFPNVAVGLRIFLSIPATVASAERSFSTLKRIKNVLRSTMCQDRLSSLGVLAVEQELVRKCDLDVVVSAFARRKARKVNFL